MYSQGQIEKIAGSIRTSLNLSCPYDSFRAVELLNGRIGHTIEDMFIAASIRKNGAKSFTIYLNLHKPYARETIAHELGHLFLHMGFLLNKELWDAFPNEQFKDSARYRINGNYTKEEREADEFAAEFLMPKDEFIAFAERHLDSNQYAIPPIAEHFHVSKVSVINRGKWLGIFER